jgi:hypothetical protein
MRRRRWAFSSCWLARCGRSFLRGEAEAGGALKGARIGTGSIWRCPAIGRRGRLPPGTRPKRPAHFAPISPVPPRPPVSRRPIRAGGEYAATRVRFPFPAPEIPCGAMVSGFRTL